MLAYSCLPETGSESGVGWRFAAEMAKVHDVWVVTQGRNQNAIERYLATKPHPALRFVYHSVPLLLDGLANGHQGIQIHYYLWQLTVCKAVARLHRETGFDVAHHTVWARYWMPSGLRNLRVPFVWGPVGAAESTPSAFIGGLPLGGKIIEAVRNAARRIARLDPALRATASRAAIALVTTPATGRSVARLGCSCVQQMPDVAFSDQELAYFRELPCAEHSTFRAICIGRLLYWKGFHLAIQAFAEFSRCHPDSELWIVNDGTERGRLERLAQRVGVRHAVRFWGKLETLREVHLKLAECNVLVHPALRESFGSVCLEAMAAAKPVICLDIGGPATQVAQSTGFLIAPHSEQAAVQGIAQSLAILYSSPQLRRELGRAGQQRAATEFSGSAVFGRLQSIYSQLRPPNG